MDPRHPRKDLHRFVNGLNVRYGIGIPIPDPALSPSKRKEQVSTSTRLYTRLEIHFYHGGVKALHELTKSFDAEVKQHWPEWVKKPNADLDTLPRTCSAPLAANGTERLWLQSLFHQILDRSQPTKSFGRTQSGPAAYSTEKVAEQSTHQPKRVADADVGRTPTKRSKPVERKESDVVSKADHIFVAPQPASERGSGAAARTAELLSKSFMSLKSDTTMDSSVHTSKTSFASVFSNQDPGPISTQATMEPSTDEQRKPPDIMSSHETSFPNPGITYDRPRSTHLSPTRRSDYSSPASSDWLALLRDSNIDAQSKQSSQEQHHRPLKAEPSQPSIQSQLRSVWRTCFSCERPTLLANPL